MFIKGDLDTAVSLFSKNTLVLVVFGL